MRTAKNKLNLKTIIALSFVCAGTCSVESSHGQPVIKSFSPASGAIGTIVTIAGKNFNPLAEKNIVDFGATRATVSNATDSSLLVSVPAGATYELITVTADSLTGSSKYPFLVTFSGGDSTFSENSFASELVFSGSACTNKIELSDLDDDGKPDVAYTNGCLNGISVSKNTTLGSAISFSHAVDVLTGTYPIALAVYDLDGDGKKDITTANFGGNSISVFKNTSSNGSISFAAKKDYAAGESTYGVTVADLNGDGKPDVIATNEYDFPGTISVFVNTSTKDSLSFAAKLTFNVGDEPRRIIACNLNNDSKPDLAVADQGSSAATVLINTSTLSTVSFISQEYAVTPGSGPESISCGDLDGDGKNDLVVANNNQPGTVSILKNTSIGGNVSFSLQTDLPTMDYPYSTAINDLNGDGKPDIAAASHYMSNDVKVYRNVSKAGSLAFDLPVNYTTASPHENVIAGDLNGDNKPDILLQDDLDSYKVFSVLTNNQGSVLAVNLLNLKASRSGNNVLLEWQSGSDVKTAYFNMERSQDGVHFEKIAKIDADANNNNLQSNYSFTDADAIRFKNDAIYYRLKKYTKDGSFEYSNTVSIQLNHSALIIYPVPVADVLNISGLNSTEITHLRIIDERGNIVAKRLIQNTSFYQWNVSSLSKGVYYLQIISDTKTVIKFEK